MLIVWVSFKDFQYLVNLIIKSCSFLNKIFVKVLFWNSVFYFGWLYLIDPKAVTHNRKENDLSSLESWEIFWLQLLSLLRIPMAMARVWSYHLQNKVNLPSNTQWEDIIWILPYSLILNPSRTNNFFQM